MEATSCMYVTITYSISLCLKSDVEYSNALADLAPSITLARELFLPCCTNFLNSKFLSSTTHTPTNGVGKNTEKGGESVFTAYSKLFTFSLSKTHTLLSFSKLAYTRGYPSYKSHIRRDLDMQIFINLVLHLYHSIFHSLDVLHKHV